MGSKERLSAIFPWTAVCGAAGVAAAIIVLGVGITLSPRQAQATPQYAKETGLPCGKCHVNPAGGKETTEFGKKFAANGHKLPKGEK
jgi:hypothetical protein